MLVKPPSNGAEENSRVKQSRLHEGRGPTEGVLTADQKMEQAAVRAGCQSKTSNSSV